MPFTSIFDANNDSAICPQLNIFNNRQPEGTIDCLNLNIYVPNTVNSTNKLPVILWIYGGSFRSGFNRKSLYGPTFLVRHDVIVVAINYRIGAYGFLCLDIPKVPGNQGLKDQLIALRWVKNNIEAFGGDIDRITLTGSSAGGASAEYHLAFAEEDLFNSIIVQSAGFTSYDALQKSDPSAALKLAATLGFVTDDTNEALQFLSETDTNSVVLATFATDIYTVPCVEKCFKNVERYVTAEPTEVALPQARTKPIMIGYNNNEYAVNFLGLNLSNVYLILEANLHYENENVTKEVLNTVRHFYTGDYDVTDSAVQQRVVNFLSDYGVLQWINRSIKKYFENGASSVFHYLFAYAGNRNLYKLLLGYSNVSGAIHADELGYMFNPIYLSGTPTPEDQLMIDRVTTLWTNFVKYDNPTPAVTDLLPIQWPVVTSEKMNCFKLDLELEIVKRPFHRRMALWDLFHIVDDAYRRGDSECDRKKISRALDFVYKLLLPRKTRNYAANL